MNTIFSNEFFLLAKAAKLGFSDMVKLTNDALKETNREDYAAMLIEKKIKSTKFSKATKK